MFEKRNWKIYFEWIGGKDYDVLAEEFHLSKTSIKDICTSKIPDKIKRTYWQTANQYAKWRAYKRKYLEADKANPTTAEAPARVDQ